MSNILVVIIIIIILAALAGSVIAGIILFTMIFDDMEFVILEISELIPELPNDSNFDDIKIEKKVQPTSKTQPEQIPYTAIAIQINKSTYAEIVELHVSGKITNYNFSEETYIDVYSVVPGEKMIAHDYFDKTDNNIIDFGFSLDRFNHDVLYEVIVAHNGVSAAKTFTVERLDD